MWKQIKKVIDALLSSLVKFISHAHTEQGRTEHWFQRAGPSSAGLHVSFQVCRSFSIKTQIFSSRSVLLCERVHTVLDLILSYRDSSVPAFGAQLPCCCWSCTVFSHGAAPSHIELVPWGWPCTVTFQTHRYMINFETWDDREAAFVIGTEIFGVPYWGGCSYTYPDSGFTDSVVSSLIFDDLTSKIQNLVGGLIWNSFDMNEV